jgi:adenylyl-sulfate kinase
MRKSDVAGTCVWFTGLPCAGKTTIAQALLENLSTEGERAAFLDADAIRPILCPDLGYSREDRRKNLLRIAYVAHLLVQQGGTALVATISPFEDDRLAVRAMFGPGTFLQVHVDTSVEECERRDVKGLYAKARQGLIPEFTGISSPYETPLVNEVVCRTPDDTVAACAETILAALKRLRASHESRVNEAVG